MFSPNELSERELIARLAEHFKQSEETCRALAQLRKDERWLKVVGLITTLRGKTAELAVRRMRQ